jgi:hypothetical protein
MKPTTPAAGEAVPTIQNLFSAWLEQEVIANHPGPLKAADDAVDAMFSIKTTLMATPAITLEDLAAKVLVSTDRGDSVLDRQIIDEVARLTEDGAKPGPDVAWRKIRRLARELSAALAEAGDVAFAHVTPAGKPFAITFGNSGNDDPLVAAIQAYEEGNAKFCSIPSVVSDPNEERWIAETYGPPMKVLQDWEDPARSMEGVIRALKVLDDDSLVLDGIGTSLLYACRAYLEGEMI